MPSAVASTYSGDTWEQIRVKVVNAFDAANGRAQIAGVWYPGASNAQALAILQALRGLLVAFKVSPSTDWSLWYAALGYHQLGDKFDLSTKHGAAPAPADVVAGVWEFFARAAARLDYVGASPKLLVLNLTYSAYERAARDAYAQIKRERAAAAAKAKVKVPMPPGIDPPDIEPPEPPDNVPLPIVPTPDTGGLAILAVLVVAAIARKKRK